MKKENKLLGLLNNSVFLIAFMILAGLIGGSTVKLLFDYLIKIGKVALTGFDTFVISSISALFTALVGGVTVTDAIGKLEDKLNMKLKLPENNDVLREEEKTNEIKNTRVKEEKDLIVDKDILLKINILLEVSERAGLIVGGKESEWEEYLKNTYKYKEDEEFIKELYEELLLLASCPINEIIDVIKTSQYLDILTYFSPHGELLKSVLNREVSTPSLKINKRGC